MAAPAQSLPLTGRLLVSFGSLRPVRPWRARPLLAFPACSPGPSACRLALRAALARDLWPAGSCTGRLPGPV